jgi:hypothetical protein
VSRKEIRRRARPYNSLRQLERGGRERQLERLGEYL